MFVEQVCLYCFAYCCDLRFLWSYLRKIAKRLYTKIWLFGDFVDLREHWRLLAVRFNKYAINTFCSRYPFIELQPWPTSWSRRQVVICDWVENQVQLILMNERSMIQFVKQEHEVYYNLNSTDDRKGPKPLWIYEGGPIVRLNMDITAGQMICDLQVSWNGLGPSFLVQRDVTVPKIRKIHVVFEK